MTQTLGKSEKGGTLLNSFCEEDNLRTKSCQGQFEKGKSQVIHTLRTQKKNSRWKEIAKIRAGKNEMENRKATEKINKPKSCFFEMINKIDI